jgi:transposase
MAIGYRIQLTAAQAAEWHRRWWAAGTTARERERLEIIRQSARHQSVPTIADRLGVHEQTVRRVVKRFLAEGFGALADRPRPGRPPTLTAAALAAVEAHLDAAAAAGETWTGPRLAAWLATTRQVRVNHEYLVARLRARKFRWKRTKRSVRHKADPDRQAHAKADLAVLTF